MSTSRTAHALATLLNARTPGGARRYSDEAILHFVPYYALELLSAAPDHELPPFVARVVATKLERLEISPTTAPTDALLALREHYRACPVDPRLEAQVAALLREVLAEGSLADRGFLRFSGAPPATYVPRAAPPKGATRASPLARFALTPPDRSAPHRRRRRRRPATV